MHVHVFLDPELNKSSMTPVNPMELKIVSSFFFFSRNPIGKVQLGRQQPFETAKATGLLKPFSPKCHCFP